MCTYTHTCTYTLKDRGRSFIGMKRSLAFWMEHFSTGTIVDLEREKERERD